MNNRPLVSVKFDMDRQQFGLKYRLASGRHITYWESRWAAEQYADVTPIWLDTAVCLAPKWVERPDD